MVWILFALVAVFVVVVLVAVVTGRLTPDPMAEPVGSTPHHGLPEGAWAADDIDLVRFDTALRGYRMDQVDDVLDRVFHALSTGQPAPDIDGARFRPTRFGEGYDMEEVDDFLDELAAGLPDQ